MATDTLQRGSPEPNPARGARGGRVIEYQQYIDSELGKTRRRVKWIDLWTSMAVLAAGFIAYLLVAAVIDHLLPGGLGTFGRWLLLIGLLVGVAAHLVAVFVPFLLRKVNPVYAAAAIEHSGGTMKNTLINFLLLRKETALPDGVIDAMKEQAAVRLHNVSSDASIDRTSLLRWCYVLAAVMVGSLIYAVVAPKDSFRSIHRVLSPWSDLAAPTRVRIEVIEPGNTDRRRDDVVNVTLRAAGLRAGDAVTLFYSATGNPADDVPLPMQGDEAHYHWKTVLPPGSEGLKQDLFYYIQAGDTQSPRYRIRVIATPVINVRTVTFDYPAYTGLPPRTVERQGDLKALEGTRITLTAEANQPIKSAHAAFDKARTKDVELRADGLTAVGGFDLALLKDRLTPAHTSYLIRFANIDGEENPKPTEYKIEVTPDQSPEVRVVEPNTPVEKELSLPLGGLLRVTAAARDPDFQLAELTVVLRKAGSLLREERLLSEPRYGEFSNTLVLSPERYNLRVGEKFTFRVRAADNKSPNPNVVETKDYTVVVTPPTGQPQPQDPRRDPQQNPNQPNRDPNQPQPPQPNGQNGGKPNNEGAPQPGNPPPNDARGQPNDPQNANQQPGNNGQPQPPGGNDSGKPNAGDGGRPQSGDSPQNGEPQQGRESEQGRDQQPPKNPSDNSPANGEQKSGTDRKQPEQPIDPSVDPGKAFEELQKHFEQKDKQNNPGQSGDQTQPKPPEAGEQNRQPQPRGEQPQNGEQKSGDQKSGEQKSGEQKSGEQKSGSQPAGSQQNGGSQPNNSQPSGSQQNPEQKSGGGQPGENQSGAGQSGGSQPQKSPDGGAAGDQRQAGGKDGTGRSQSDAPAGNQQGTGGAQNQPSQKADDPNAKPGGENGAKTTDQKPSGGDAERRPGENVGGAEEKRPAEGSPTGDAKPEQRPGDSPSGKPQGNSQERNAQGSGEQPGTAPDPRSGNQPQPGQNETGKPNDSSNAGQPRPNGTPNAGQPGVNRESTPANSGQGTQSGGDPSKPDAKSPRAGEKPTEPQPGSKPSVNEKNPQGSQSENAGREGKAPADGGSPKQEEVAKPRNYQKGQDAASNDQEGNKEEGKTPSHSKSESDAQGSTSGDRSAKNGEEGGGQRSQQSGTGAAGQSQAGEQGGGVSGQEGDAATSNQGGSKVRSGDPSQGKPGEQKGPGSQSQNPGEQPGGSQSSQSGQSHSGNDGRPSDDRQQNNSSNDKSGAQNPSGGGNVNPNGNSGSDDQPPPSRNTAAPPADPANLDYAQKVTDLTLERLKQQLDKGQVDPELLERFKSREALEEFARRWEAMRQSAKQPGPSGDAARKQFQENLKSLGLQPRTTQQQGSAAAGDEFRDVRGRARSEPPAKYADQYRAYQTGVGQAEK